jgi:hypothetical protein
VAVGLILGSIQFRDREVPDTINFGGKQILAIHKNIGGSRVIDAMGPDPDEIHWEGLLLTFPNSAYTADERARQIDAMRQSGAQQVLLWPGFAYTVVVAHFEGIYKNQWEIRYRISCAVVSDAFTVQSVATLTQAITSDLSSIQSMAE